MFFDQLIAFFTRMITVRPDARGKAKCDLQIVDREIISATGLY
jgi:hypothetical protein